MVNPLLLTHLAKNRAAKLEERGGSGLAEKWDWECEKRDAKVREDQKSVEV